jgi:hypothetical protein
MTDIRTKAMLVTLSVSYWTANASDDRVIDEISVKHKSERDQHQYRKILVHPDAINAVKAVRSRARSYYFDKTGPWVDGGTRILPSSFYLEFAEKMREFRGEYEEAVNAFVKKYSALKGEARKRLGTLFKEEDYPSTDALRSKFSWDMGVFPIPAKDDWRIDLGGKEDAAIKRQIEEKVAAAVENYNRDLFTRLAKVVKAMSETMRKSADPTFRDSIVGNIREVCTLAQSMNISGDHDLDKMIRQVQQDLGKIDPAELRDDKKKRKAVADTADEILAKLSGYIGK